MSEQKLNQGRYSVAVPLTGLSGEAELPQFSRKRRFLFASSVSSGSDRSSATQPAGDEGEGGILGITLVTKLPSRHETGRYRETQALVGIHAPIWELGLSIRLIPHVACASSPDGVPLLLLGSIHLSSREPAWRRGCWGEERSGSQRKRPQQASLPALI